MPEQRHKLEYVTDKQGEHFELKYMTDDATLYLRLRYQRQQVGTADITFNEDENALIVTDLRIGDANLEPLTLTLWRKLNGSKPQLTPFQGRGLGNVLLKAIIKEAWSAKIRYLRIEVPHAAQLETPFLLNWLMRRDFRRAPHLKKQQDVTVLEHDLWGDRLDRI